MVGFSLFVALVATGCAARITPTAEGESPSFEEIVASAIADARAGGASSSQIGILGEASANGEMSLELARQAARSAVVCMTNAGMTATYLEEVNGEGLLTPGYTANIGLDENSPLEQTLESCDTSEDFWVNYVYQIQPSSVAIADAHTESLAPVFRDCLEEAGVDTDPDATGRELQRQIIDEYVASNGAIDCLSTFAETGD